MFAVTVAETDEKKSRCGHFCDFYFCVSADGEWSARQGRERKGRKLCCWWCSSIFESFLVLLSFPVALAAAD